MAAVFIQRDFCEIYCRLFDHRPAIKSEVGFFVKEFEEKRKNQEQVKLQKVLEFSREINENLMAACVQHLSTSIPELNVSVNGVIEQCQKIISEEKDTSEADSLVQKRVERSKEFTAYLDTMCVRVSDIEREFDEEVKRVENYYSELSDIPSAPAATV